MNHNNKKVGFWIRFLSRLFDVVFFSLFSISSAFLLIKKQDDVWDFKFPLFFYLWILITILLIVLVFLIPLLFWNRTLGMLIFRIKVIFKNNNKLKSIFLRELVFSIGWIFSILVFAVVINHTMFSKVASYKKVNFNTLENLRIGIVSSLSSFVILFQLLFSISVIVRKDRGSIHDNISSTITVWSNKYVKVKENNKNNYKGFKPRLIKQEYIEWVE